MTCTIILRNTIVEMTLAASTPGCAPRFITSTEEGTAALTDFSQAAVAAS